MEGIQSKASYLSAKALEATDPTYAATALDYMAKAVQFHLNYAVNSANKGAYYFAPVPESAACAVISFTICSNGLNESQARTLLLESMRGAAEQFRISRDPTLGAWIKQRLTDMWCSSGTVCGYGSGDTHWIEDYNPPSGVYVYESYPLSPLTKWMGQFGYSVYAALAAVMTSAPAPTILKGAVTIKGASVFK
jgi:hypothetical protein